MNRTDFINMIEDSVPVNRQMMGEVYELIDIFPYFQSAHLLLLKGLQSNDDVKLEKQLRISAIHIADREVLYYLLKTKTDPGIESGETKKDNSMAGPIVSDIQQAAKEIEKNIGDLAGDIEKENVAETSKELQSTSNSIQEPPELISSDPDLDSSGGMLLIDEDTPSDNEDNIFYMDPGFSVPEYDDLLELDLDEFPGDIPDEEIHGRTISEKTDRDIKTQNQSELIDKFIITNPRIEPIKGKSDLPLEDISRPFVEQEGSFVTETLARIYIAQGYYSKAIDIYERLSLKFPEKSSYFAFQIEKVKELIKK